MGNRHTTPVTETDQPVQVQPPFTFCPVSLKKLITKTSQLKLFKAIEQENQQQISLITFSYEPIGVYTSQIYEKYISSLTQLRHPCLVDAYSHYFPPQEIHSEAFRGAVMAQSCDTCLSNLLNPLLTSYKYTNIDSSSCYSPVATRQNLRVFEENDILNMVLTIVEAVIYCYDKGINVKVSEGMILICQQKQKFMFAPFSLDEKEPFSASFLCSETLMEDPKDEDNAENRDLRLKKEIFKIGIYALKMATLYNFEEDLDTVKHLLEGVKENYPSLDKVLKEIMFEIFTDEYDIKAILKKFSSANIHLSLLSDIFRSKPTEDLADQDIEDLNSLEGQLELGYTYNTCGSFEASIQALQNVALMYFNKFSRMTIEDQKELGNVFEKIAESSIGLGLEEQASEYIMKALEQRDILIKEDDPHIVEINHRAGLLFERNGECKKAVDFLTKASELCELFEDDIEFFNEKQILIHKDLLRIKEKAFGRENLSYGESLERISLSFEALGKTQDALDVRNEIKELYEKYYSGTKDGAFINNQIKIGELLCLSYDYVAALKIYTECLELSKSAYGKESVKYARCLKKIGQVHQKKKHYHTAINYYDQTLKIRQQLFGASHKKTLNTIIALAKCHEKGKSSDKALEYYQQALEGLRKRKGQQREDYLKVCFKVAKMLENKHDMKSSLEYYRECIGVCEKKDQAWYCFDLGTKQGHNKLIEHGINNEARG